MKWFARVALGTRGPEHIVRVVQIALVGVQNRPMYLHLVLGASTWALCAKHVVFQSRFGTPEDDQKPSRHALCTPHGAFRPAYVPVLGRTYLNMGMFKTVQWTKLMQAYGQHRSTPPLTKCYTSFLAAAHRRCSSRSTNPCMNS